jgi:hypothetical protein
MSTEEPSSSMEPNLFDGPSTFDSTHSPTRPAQHRPTAPKVHGSVAASRTPPVASTEYPARRQHTVPHETYPQKRVRCFDPYPTSAPHRHLHGPGPSNFSRTHCHDKVGPNCPSPRYQSHGERKPEWVMRGSTLDNSETNSPPQVPTTDAGPGPPPNPNTEAVAKTKTKARLTGEASASTATAATAMEEEGEERPRARVDLRLVGDYELQKLVGKGSFARVFRAAHRRARRQARPRGHPPGEGDPQQHLPPQHPPAPGHHRCTRSLPSPTRHGREWAIVL